MSTPLIEIRRYPRLNDARESALALASKDLAYSIDREGDEWALRVEENVREIALAEVAAYEAEQQVRPHGPPARTFEKIQPVSLFITGWLLSGFFFVQQVAGRWWTDLGAASNDAILQHGEWWRTVTALTLHGDLGHLVANLATGLLFAAFLLPEFGTGLTWLMIVLSGILGNAINAWGYRGEPHHSIGASTAAFGALGLLVGEELYVRWAHPSTRSRWQLVVPLGAGLALLAYLGVGEKHDHVDFMAHWWGLCAGVALGWIAAALRLKARMSKGLQRAAALASVLLIAVAWGLALHARR